MRDCEITLKNLYRILTVRDYPVYSAGVLSGEEKKGLTLLSFWNRVLLYDWRAGEAAFFDLLKVDYKLFQLKMF